MIVDCPKIFVISEGAISASHGTGVHIQRHFSDYPIEKLCNVHCGNSSTAAWPISIRAEAEVIPPTPWNHLNSLTRVYDRAIFKLGIKHLRVNRPIVFHPSMSDIISRIGEPQVIYSVVYANTGLALVDYLCSQIPNAVPLVQYFLDYQIGDGFFHKRYLRSVLSRATEVWALTDEIVEAINPLANEYGKQVRIQPCFYMDLPAEFKRVHRSIKGGEFTCIVSGNFWQTDLVRILRGIWRRLQKEFPGLGPIQWSCHPESVRRVRAVVGDVEPEITPVWFPSQEELVAHLIKADMAIVPFNVHRCPENNYARYSLPSRLTELLGVGLPVFCIAGDQTPLARYISRNSLGPVCDAENEELLAQRLMKFIKNHEERAATGERARQFAEKQFELGSFQQFLYSKLYALAYPERARRSK